MLIIIIKIIIITIITPLEKLFDIKIFGGFLDPIEN